MAFTPGTPKPKNSGRKKGQKNLKTLLKAKCVLVNANLNPIEEIIKLLPELSPRDRLEALKYLQGFVECHIKENIEDENNFQFENVKIDNLIPLVKEK